MHGVYFNIPKVTFSSVPEQSKCAIYIYIGLSTYIPIIYFNLYIYIYIYIYCGNSGDSVIKESLLW